MTISEHHPGVYFADTPIVEVSATLIAELKARLPQSNCQRVRLCAHCRDEDIVQEMLIVMGRGSYVQPHLHVAKSESLHVVEGELTLVTFDEIGQIKRTLQLGSYSSGKSFYERLPPGLFHTVVLHSEIAVLHEVVQGPFRQADTIYADWAPSGENRDTVDAYVAQIRKSIAGTAGSA
jgi:cupin fold WbuC family metalloprotein